MGKFNFNASDFDKLKIEAELFYHAIHEIHCPYFQEKITFNAKGLRHLKFKSDQQARPRSDQYARLKLINLAPEVLKKSHTLQGVWKIKRLEEQNTNSRWEHVIKEVTFFEFIAIIDKIRMKIIIKQTEGGEKHFWSVIPAWGIDKQNSKRILHTGDPEHD